MSNPSFVGRYQIVNPIARGGMGKVYRAWDPMLDRHVAIKLLNEDNEELRQRFAREARSAAGLRHPHIVTIFDVGEDNGRPFIAMELVQGKTLSELIRGRAPLVIRRKLEIIEELCDGLAFAHKGGIIHRDIKPANVMLDANGEVKILDFGIARVSESTTGFTRAGALIGSLNYMSPEQVSGRTVDQRSDIFAVGAVLYELLSYRVAFPGGLDDGLLHRLLNTEPEPLDSVCREADPDLGGVVARCLKKNPDQRYPELGAMIKDLQRILARLPATDDSTHLYEPKDPPPAAVARLTPTPTPDASRRGVDKEELARRRSNQIQTYLETAQNALASSDFEGAIAACEDVLLRDAEHRRALELLDRARAGLDERQAEEWLDQAERELRRGALTAALTLIERAETLSPTSIHAAELRRMADEAVRERERARQRADATRQGLERAHELFDKGMFREADAAADEVLALEPTSPEAIRLKSRAGEGIEAQQRTELERRAREAVREARGIFGLGNHDAAIELLSQFEPQHTLVSQALAQLRAEGARLAKQRQIEAERRVKQQRIAAALLVARTEVNDQQYGDALQRLRTLIDEEGDAPDISALVQEAEAGQAELDRIANIARDVAEHVARAAGHLARNDLTEALSRADAALALDSGNAAAAALRTRIQERLRVEAERREAEERRVREREQTIATALEEAERTGSHDAAIAIINGLLELDHDHVQARAHLERRQKALAQEQAERRRIAEEQRARREQVERLLASARQALDRGDLDAGQRATASALQLDPQNPDLQFLSDDIAAAQAEREQAAAATLAESSYGATVVMADLPLSQPGVPHVASDAMEPGTSAQIPIGTPAAVRSFKTVPRRSGRLWIYVLAASAIAVAAGVAIGYVAWPGPAAPAQPGAGVASVARPPEPQVARPPTSNPAPATSDPAPASESNRVAALLDQARLEMARGNWQGGLATAAAELKLRPNDTGFTKLLGDMWQQSRDRMIKERDSADSAGRPAVGSASYRDAARREQEASGFARAGQVDAAIRASREAGDLYQRAAADGKIAAARPPLSSQVPSSSGPAPGAPRPQTTSPSAPPSPPPIPAAANPTAPPSSASPPANPPVSTGTVAAAPQPATQQPVPAPVPVVTTPAPTPPPSPVTQPPAAPAPAQTSQPSTAGGRASPPSEEPAVHSVLAAYANAYSSLDAGAVKRVYPAVNELDLRRTFADMKSQQMQIQAERIAVSGATATVACTVVTTFQGQVGGVRKASQQTVFRLQKRDDVWYIVFRQ